MEERARAFLTLHTLTEELETKQRAIAQLLNTPGDPSLGPPSWKARRSSMLSMDVQLLEDARAAADANYTKIKKRNLEELERYMVE